MKNVSLRSRELISGPRVTDTQGRRGPRSERRKRQRPGQTEGLPPGRWGVLTASREETFVWGLKESHAGPQIRGQRKFLKIPRQGRKFLFITEKEKTFHEK